MEIKKEIVINASIEKAWQVLGVEFADAYKWASALKHSSAQNTSSLNGSSCDIRGCDVNGMGKIKEKLISFKPDNHTLTYTIFEGLPFMLKTASNNWKLISLGNNKTKLEMFMTAETKGLMGKLMKPMLKMNFGKMGQSLCDDFKYYVEKGKPSPAKIKAMS